MSLLLSVVTLLSLASVTFGCWLAWRPLGWIVGGLAGLLLVAALERPRRRPVE